MLLVAEPTLGEAEKLALSEVIESGWITMGDRVRAFEQAFAELHNTSDAVAVSSCTAGLHLALQAFGIGPGDEVLVPSLTFVATANSVIYTGAQPVFVDIESLDLPHLSYADAARKCTARTRAVITMHYGGYVADAASWREFADSRGLILIEDSAHALGRERGEIFGDAAVFSFFGNKNMTTAEGGVVVSPHQGILRTIRQARGHGMTHGTMDRLRSELITYDVTMLGYNYRMDELRAAVGLVQLRSLSRWNHKREAISQAYRAFLQENCPEVIVPFSKPRTSSHHIMPVILPPSVDRQQVAVQLRERQIQTTVHYPPTHELSWYRERVGCKRLPHTEEFARRELTLPLHPKMEEWRPKYVTLALADILSSVHGRVERVA